MSWHHCVTGCPTHAGLVQPALRQKDNFSAGFVPSEWKEERSCEAMQIRIWKEATARRCSAHRRLRTPLKLCERHHRTCVCVLCPHLDSRYYKFRRVWLKSANTSILENKAIRWSKKEQMSYSCQTTFVFNAITRERWYQKNMFYWCINYLPTAFLVRY